MDFTNCSMISIEQAFLHSDGEVPRAWLSQYEDFKTWSDFNFLCNHCHVAFRNIIGFTLHLCELQVLGQLPVGCNIDSYTEYLPKYINGMASTLPLLKFCCVLCSKSFFNMQVRGLPLSSNEVANSFSFVVFVKSLSA